MKLRKRKKSASQEIFFNSFHYHRQLKCNFLTDKPTSVSNNPYGVDMPLSK